MMGAGKTSAAINFMERNHRDMRFLFITPYLEEGERIAKACPLCDFQAPKSFGSKVTGIKALLRQKRNIVSTHALFGLLDTESLELIQDGQYVLIMDEVYEAVTPYQMNLRDLELLVRAGIVYVDEHGVLVWSGDDSYDGSFKKNKQAIQNNVVVLADTMQCDEDCGHPHQQLFMVLSTQSFRCFSAIYVLTYMFDGSVLKLYFDCYGFSYRYIGVEKDSAGCGFCFCEYNPASISTNGLGDKIHLWAPKKLSDVGMGRGSLSYSWFQDYGRESKQMSDLRKSLQNFFGNITKTKSADNLWTTYRFAKQKLVAPGYARGFESHNARATNKYRDKVAVAYAVNKYLNPNIMKFFNGKGVTIDEDRYALSSMVQFIWRSAIRDGRDISLYIPSLRMRRLFEKWLQEVNGS